MSGTVTITEARATLPQLLDRVIAGEEVTITRHGQPIALVVRPDALRFRRAEREVARQRALAVAREFGEQLEQARRAPLAPATLSAERAEELIAEIRAGRDSR